ncbi:MAG: DMT family transporter [Pseudomonadota bacterium]
MTLTVFLAVLGAALLHAVWNALVKGGRDKTVAMAAVVVGQMPCGCVVLLFVPTPSVESLPYLACGVALHLGYQFFLLSSYRLGDLTQVYPIARGSAPLLVAAVSVILLQQELKQIEVLAIMVISIAIASLAIVRHGDGQRNPKAALLALCTGCFIAGYSLVDGLGARVAGTALGFYAWAVIGNAIVFVLVVGFKSPDVLRRLPSEAAMLTLIGGGASFIAYSLVMWAFTKAPIPLVTALRETSIIFALVIGVVFFKERASLVKFLSIIGVLLGAALMRIGSG